MFNLEVVADDVDEDGSGSRRDSVGSDKTFWACDEDGKESEEGDVDGEDEEDVVEGLEEPGRSRRFRFCVAVGLGESDNGFKP